MITSLIFVFLSFSSVVRADEILTDDLVNEYRKTLSELLAESEEEDLAHLKEMGKLYFHIGQETHNRQDVKMAIDLFKKVLEKEPHDPETMVHLGSAYTLRARDFPLKWLANITPFGLIRIYYVRKGINIMDDAIERDAMHPVVRLIRGITSVSLPNLFFQCKKGITDLELILSWIENPSLNERYSDLIQDQGFMADAYYRIGEVYRKKGDMERASVLFKKVAALAPNTPLSKAAQRSLSGLSEF